MLSTYPVAYGQRNVVIPPIIVVATNYQCYGGLMFIKPPFLTNLGFIAKDACNIAV